MSETINNVSRLVTELRRILSIIDEYITVCDKESLGSKYLGGKYKKLRDFCSDLSRIKDTLILLIRYLEIKQEEISRMWQEE